MYPGSFDYHRAGTVAEARKLLAAHADRDARLLAGGQGLVPSMKLDGASPDVLVDVSGVDALSGVSVDDDGATVGALTTHADLLGHDGLAAATPVLGATARHVADRQVRNRGTLGGNLAEADPAADLPAAVLAADATLRVEGPDGDRAVPATDFFRGDGETALGGRDVLTGVRVPRHDAAAYAKKTHPATGYAMVGVAATLDVEDETDAGDGAAGGTIVADAGVAATGVHDPAVRLPTVEERLAGRPVDEVDVEGAAERAKTDLDDGRLVGDAHASAGFRAEILPGYVERALSGALEEAGAGTEGTR